MAKRRLVEIGHPNDYQNERLHLREMAYSKNIIIQKLLQYSESRLEHLLKLYYHRKAFLYIHGWMGSIYKCTIQTHKDKKTNKLPTYQLIFETLWLNEEDMYQSHHDAFIKTFNYSLKELPKIKQPDLKGSAAFCEAYFNWLSTQLSEKGSVELQEVKETLKELLGKFKYETHTP